MEDEEAKYSVSAEKIAELKGKYGKRLHLVTVPEGQFAIITPDRNEWRKFVALLSDDDTKPDAFDAIAMACVVSPPIEPVLNDYPGLSMTIGNKIAELAGLHKRADAKKA